MPELMEDLLRRGARETEAAVRIGTPVQVRARGDRRRVRGRGGTALVALAALGALTLPLYQSPATPEPEASAPTRSPAAPGTIPDGFRMPHEGEPGWAPADTRTVRENSDDCGPGDPTEAGRTADRTMRGPDGHQQLFAYPSRAAAVAVVEALFARYEGCGLGPRRVATRGVDPTGPPVAPGKIVVEFPGTPAHVIDVQTFGTVVWLTDGTGAGTTDPFGDAAWADQRIVRLQICGGELYC